MVNSIPTFKLDVSEGIIDVDRSADRLFGYCVEASKGPVLEPIFVASNTEAKKIEEKQPASWVNVQLYRIFTVRKSNHKF